MAKEEKQETSELEKALDESLDTLQKAAEGTETISKVAKKDKKDEDEDAKGEEKKEDEDAKGEKKEEDEDAKGKKKEEDEDAKGEKKEESDDEDEAAKKEGYRKSTQDNLAKSESVSNAIEVSKFLDGIVKSFGEMLGDMRYRLSKLEKSNKALAGGIVKAFSAQNDMVKSLSEEIGSFGGRPLPRKSVDGKFIEKSFRNDEKGQKNSLSKSQIAEKMVELECSNKIPYGTTTKFEMSGEMSKSVESLVLGESKE